ncbi:MAG: apolipoprotein N-acyltransferase [Azospirillaceae bacterium]|nr:apolipoprotein N-acyltransferase [Azospirillaceae bacterium]
MIDVETTDGTSAPAAIEARSRRRTLAARLAGLTGWRRHAAALGLGAVSSLALPPAYAVPVLAIAFPGLLWLLAGATRPRTAFALGWWFGFGQFVLGLYWISFALLVDIDKFWWMMPFAVAGLPAVLACYTGAATATLSWAQRRWNLGGPASVLGLAVAWTVWEFARGHLFTGFPWNLVGYSWVAVLPMLQFASVAGIYGLSLITVALAGVPALFGLPGTSRRLAIRSSITAVVVMAGLFAFGTLRLHGDDGATVPGVMLRLVQGDVRQVMNWSPLDRERTFQHHLSLSAERGRETTVIWPETAAPFFLQYDMPHRLAMAAVTPPGGLILTGTVRAEQRPDEAEPRIFNSLMAVDGSGAILASYDKAHLVPFGEYVPLRGLLPIAALAADRGDFSAGPGPRTLHLPGLPPVSPLICYEAIFPGEVTARDDRPQWLLNITNDAWYLNSAGPHQHFAIAQVRAVEEGLPLVRAANTGISGVVDSYGRITARLGLGQSGVIDANLPQALPNPTLFSRFGHMTVGVMLFIFTLAAARARHWGRG